MQKYYLEHHGSYEGGYFYFYKVEDVMLLVKAARDFIDIDNEIHSITPDKEDRSAVVEKIGRYIEARDKLSSLIKPIEEEG